jgi:membrane protein DedA with SNARE-associated domain
MWPDLTQLLLDSVSAYGALALGAATLVSAIGLPLPASLLLLAAGAFARQGLLDGPSAILLAAGGAILGDVVSYALARTGGALTTARVQALPAWQRARGLFQRWGALAIFLSRFALTPLALPVNVLAGSTRYALRRFLAPVLFGEGLWAVLFCGLGYVFADQWSALSSAASNLTTVLAATAAVAGILLWLRARTGQARIPAPIPA